MSVHSGHLLPHKECVRVDLYLLYCGMEVGNRCAYLRSEAPLRVVMRLQIRVALRLIVEIRIIT